LWRKKNEGDRPERLLPIKKKRIRGGTLKRHTEVGHFEVKVEGGEKDLSFPIITGVGQVPQDTPKRKRNTFNE